MAGGWRVLACCAFIAGALGAAAGCGSPPSTPPSTVEGVTPTAGAGAEPAVAASPSATPAATPSASPSATPSLVGGVPVEDLCAFLASGAPRLDGQPPVGAIARLDADLTDFYAYRFLPRPPGAEVDAATGAACPDARFAVLVAIGLPDLKSL